MLPEFLVPVLELSKSSSRARIAGHEHNGAERDARLQYFLSSDDGSDGIRMRMIGEVDE
jgi:hypothetical protein